MRKPLTATRRGTLAAISATAAIATFPALAEGATGAVEVFCHGVASGDPDATSVVLWTRVTVAAPLEVEWQLASDPRFNRVVREGRVAAGPERDFTVKVLAEGLEPGGRYFYRFRAAGVTSRVVSSANSAWFLKSHDCLAWCKGLSR